MGRLLDACAASAAQRQWRSLGTRSVTEARAHMIAIMRQQVSFAAAISHARLRLTRLELIGHEGRIAGRHASDFAPFISPTVYEMYSGGSMGGGAGRAGRMGGGARW